MKKTLFQFLIQIICNFTISSLFISFISYGQTYKIIDGDTINRIDKNNLKQGKWKYFENSILESEGKYYNNKKEFVWISYFNNGKKKSIIEYIDDEPNGFCIFYYPFGGLKESGCWNHNRWIGNYDLYYPNGNHKFKYTFDKEGKRMGFNKEYFTNGIISSLNFCLEGRELLTIKCDSLGKIKSLRSNGDFGPVGASRVMHEVIKSENEIVFQKDRIVQQEIEAIKKLKELELANKEKEINKENLKHQKFIRNLVLVGAGLLLLFLCYVFISLAKSRKANNIIALRKAEVEEQKQLVEEKQKEILDSISYAKRLQGAILPPNSFIEPHISDFFIFYKPKDIVAGDFYWSEQLGDLFFIAAADSTGHGVPGAMVSVVCSNALNRSIKEFKLNNTGSILDKTRELVIETFEKGNADVKDGMDISLLCIDKNNNKIFWSGANNPLWYFQENQLKEITADKQPIGKTENKRPFTTHEIKYIKNSIFYLFTDGYADQFGGPKGKKYKYKQLQELLIKNSSLPMNNQLSVIENSFDVWKGELEQVDDVCVIGLKI